MLLKNSMLLVEEIHKQFSVTVSLFLSANRRLQFKCIVPLCARRMVQCAKRECYI